MKIGTFAIAAGITALGLATWMTPGKAQGPLYDRVNVNLPYSVTIGERTLQPGDYVIQQLRDVSGNSRVLLIYSDNGMKFETSAMTIPTLDNNTPEDTKVVLHHFGPDYYFDKIWIQGKNYGYEFPLPDSVKARERERMQPVSVAATYQSTTQPNESTTTTTQSTTTAQNTVPPATTQSTTTPAANNQQTTTATQSAATAPSTMQPSTTQSTMTAQNRQPSTPAPAYNESTSANREMPNTSAGWLMMLLSGGTLSGAGMMLRRKR
jgi:hypothetical protein